MVLVAYKEMWDVSESARAENTSCNTQIISHQSTSKVSMFVICCHLNSFYLQTLPLLGCGSSTAIPRGKKQQLELVAEVQTGQLLPFGANCRLFRKEKMPMGKYHCFSCCFSRASVILHPFSYLPNGSRVLVALVTNPGTESHCLARSVQCLHDTIHLPQTDGL